MALACLQSWRMMRGHQDNTITPRTITNMKTLKNKGYAIKAAGSRHSRNGRIQPCLLIQGITGGVTIDGNRRQLGRQLRQLARSL